MFGDEGMWVLPPSMMLATAIAICEMWRPPPKGEIDILRAVNALYALVFVICPIILVFTPVIDVGLWNFIYELGLSGIDVALAEWIALASYVCMLVGYFASNSFEGFRKATESIRQRVAREDATPSKRWDHVALLMGTVGTISLLVYTKEIGGLWSLVAYGMLWRFEGAPIDTPWLFLKNLALFLVPSSLIYFVIAQARTTLINKLCFVMTLGMSALILFHHGGRLQFLTYLLTIPVALMLAHRGLRLRHVITALIVGLPVVGFGKELLSLAYNPDAVTTSVASASAEPGALLFRMALEFSFPVLTLAKVLSSVPSIEPFRWFIDVYYGFVTLLPQRLFGGELPRTVTIVVLEMEHAPMPADLLSFGYFSLGVSGCFIVATLFGVASRFIEDSLGRPLSLAHAVLYAAWMFFWTFRLMYGDPSHAAIGGFHLIVATGLLMVPGWRLQHSNRTVVPQSPPIRKSK